MTVELMPARITEVDPETGWVHCSLCGWVDHTPIPDDEFHCPCLEESGCRCLCHVADEDLMPDQIMERYSDG